MEQSVRIRNVIFDLDGTLVDSVADIRAALADAFRAEGIDGFTDKIVHIPIGPPLDEMIRMLAPELTDERRLAISRAFRVAYDASPLERTTLYPGVRELICRLRDLQATLMIATNKPLVPTRKIVANIGLGDSFVDLMTPDALPGPPATKRMMVERLCEKWNLDRAATAVVGDTAGDIDAANRAGLVSVAVLWGYGDRATLKHCKPTLTIETAEGLLNCGQSIHF